MGPPARMWYIWGYMDCRSGGRAESGSGGEGAREEREQPLRQNHLTSTAFFVKTSRQAQHANRSTTRRAGKTAWLRAVSNLPYIQTDSTIGVQQTLLEVKKTDMKVDGDGRSWAIVEDGSGAIMKGEEARKRVAAEIALQETPEERRLREERLDYEEVTNNLELAKAEMELACRAGLIAAQQAHEELKRLERLDSVSSIGSA